MRGTWSIGNGRKNVIHTAKSVSKSTVGRLQTLACGQIRHAACCGMAHELRTIFRFLNGYLNTLIFVPCSTKPKIFTLCPFIEKVGHLLLYSEP